MTAKRDKVIADIESLIGAIDAVVRHLQANKRLLKRALSMISDGSEVATTMAATRAADVRQGANEVLDALETARHNSRLSIFAAGLDEGMTIGELARA
jgi:ABC-type transporter Mla subunit MlaD